jgi:hypothetical protein
MSAHMSCDRRLLGFERFVWLILLVGVAVLGAFAYWVETLPPGSTFVENLYDDPCDNIFVENASCTKFLIRGSLSPESSVQVNHRSRAHSGD